MIHQASFSIKMQISRADNIRPYRIRKVTVPKKSVQKRWRLELKKALNKNCLVPVSPQAYIDTSRGF